MSGCMWGVDCVLCRSWLDLRVDRVVPPAPMPGQSDLVPGGTIVAALARFGVQQVGDAGACMHTCAWGLRL